MRVLITASLVLAAFAFALPTASAERVCVDDPLGGPTVCMPTAVCVGSTNCFDPTDPHDVKRWVKEQFGPCTCPPPRDPW